MTDTIQAAIEKLDKEAEELKGQAQKIAQYLIDVYLKNEANAKKVLDEKKSLKDCMQIISNKARKQATANCAIIPDETVYSWISDYYGFEELQSTATSVNLFDCL